MVKLYEEERRSFKTQLLPELRAHSRLPALQRGGSGLQRAPGPTTSYCNPLTLRLHVAVWYIHRPQSDDIVTLFKAHADTIVLHGAFGLDLI